MPDTTQKISHAEIRMYRMGTGDCFIIKLFAGTKVKFKIMIDCGTWQGKKTALYPYITDLKKYVDNSVDLLIVTHEHKDHVYVFEACRELFVKDFTIKKIWMAWTEGNEGQAQQWLKDFGDKKKALAIAANLKNKALSDPDFAQQFDYEKDGDNMLAASKYYTAALNGFADLQFSVSDDGVYVGMLKGMKVVKEELAKDNIEYLHPGDIKENMEGAEGLKFYVLGPPLSWTAVKKESGGAGESYAHNNQLAQSDAFAAAVIAHENGEVRSLLPFDQKYLLDPATVTKDSEGKKYDQLDEYRKKENNWRSIEHDWLNSAGTLALRVNSMTNNLSLAIAIEFEDSGRVMLFPGDAEYGSWESWHNITWKEQSGTPGKGLTEDLLNRTVFYKVAHHLSHNGTAQRQGMEMMNHKDLAAMATLDYKVISGGWMNTMPNKALLAELLKRTKGRLMVMNENGIMYNEAKKTTLSDEIILARTFMNAQEKADFIKSYQGDDPLYLQYTVSAT